jgi:hypothetical protein
VLRVGLSHLKKSFSYCIILLLVSRSGIGSKTYRKYRK